jgi:hypothetical protein
MALGNGKMKLSELLKFYQENEKKKYEKLQYRIVIYPDGEYKMEWNTEGETVYWQFEHSFDTEIELRIFLETYYNKNHD